MSQGVGRKRELLRIGIANRDLETFNWQKLLEMTEEQNVHISIVSLHTYNKHLNEVEGLLIDEKS